MEADEASGPRVSNRDQPCRFEFTKSSQRLIRTHDKALTVVAMRVSNPDRSPV
jgi:hypothetical protein